MHLTPENIALQKVVARDWELDASSFVNREMLLSKLTATIAGMLEHRHDQLLQLLYRLDVDEGKAMNALRSGAADAPSQLAEIILLRYEQTVASRLKSREENFDDTNDDELKW